MTFVKADPPRTPAQYGAVPADGRLWPLNERRRDRYRVNRIYPTVQGEGGQAGTPMTIVRLQGCPVGCVWCDTPETWEVNDTDPTDLVMSPEMIAATVTDHGLPWALVTGGEPLWHDCTELTRALRGAQIRTALETSGVYPVTGVWHYITVSPKPAGLVPLNPAVLSRAHEIKWIVGRALDIPALVTFLQVYDEALHRLVMEPPVRVSVQPVSGSAAATALCLDAVLAHPTWRLSLQQHKLIGLA